MASNSATVHTCDSCARQTKYGIHDSSFDIDGKSLDRLWTVQIHTCIAAVQINEEWCSECIQVRILDIDLKRAINHPFKITKQKRFHLPLRGRISQLERELEMA